MEDVESLHDFQDTPGTEKGKGWRRLEFKNGFKYKHKAIVTWKGAKYKLTDISKQNIPGTETGAGWDKVKPHLAMRCRTLTCAKCLREHSILFRVLTRHKATKSQLEKKRSMTSSLNQQKKRRRNHNINNDMNNSGAIGYMMMSMQNDNENNNTKNSNNNSSASFRNGNNNRRENNGMEVDSDGEI